MAEWLDTHGERRRRDLSLKMFDLGWGSRRPFHRRPQIAEWQEEGCSLPLPRLFRRRQGRNGSKKNYVGRFDYHPV